MSRYKVHFGQITWQSPMAGLRFKAHAEGGRQLRVVEYTREMAPHWCEKGHIVHCLEGEVINEQKEGSSSVLTPGMSYVVSDDLSSHRSVTKNGVKLMIIDGDFLELKK